MKFSELLAKPLLCLAEGEVVGEIRNCVLTSERTRLLALETGDGWVLASDIRIGEGAILLPRRDRIRSAPPEPAATGLLDLLLFSADGRDLGVIRDLVFDERNRLIRIVAEDREYDRSLLLSVGENAAIICDSPEQLRRERRKLIPKRPPLSDLARVSSTFAYLIGRKVIADVFNQRGEKIVRSGTRVTLHTLQTCKQNGRLLALARSCRS